jgi:hypothetical protein
LPRNRDSERRRRPCPVWGSFGDPRALRDCNGRRVNSGSCACVDWFRCLQASARRPWCSICSV